MAEENSCDTASMSQLQGPQISTKTVTFVIVDGEVQGAVAACIIRDESRSWALN